MNEQLQPQQTFETEELGFMQRAISYTRENMPHIPTGVKQFGAVALGAMVFKAAPELAPASAEAYAVGATAAQTEQTPLPPDVEDPPVTSTPEAEQTEQLTLEKYKECKSDALNIVDDGVYYDLYPSNSRKRIRWDFRTSSYDKTGCKDYGRVKVVFAAVRYSQGDIKQKNPTRLGKPLTVYSPEANKLYMKKQRLSKPIKNRWNENLDGWVKTIWTGSDKFGGNKSVRKGNVHFG